MVYLLHFDKPFQHSRHYIGYVDGGQEELEKRLKRHRAGSGSKLMRAVTGAGIGFKVARTWPNGDQRFERHLKNMKKSSCYCPICRAISKNEGGKNCVNTRIQRV